MTGQDQIIAMRRAGLKPEFVWISDFDFAKLDGTTVRVCGDTPELLDLRFLVGITALVDGPDASRVDRIAQACAGVAKRVIANTLAASDRWLEVVKTTDTEGVMTWQA